METVRDDRGLNEIVIRVEENIEKGKVSSELEYTTVKSDDTFRKYI